jgi:hypothetical protein
MGVPIEHGLDAGGGRTSQIVRHNGIGAAEKREW